MDWAYFCAGSMLYNRFISKTFQVLDGCSKYRYTITGNMRICEKECSSKKGGKARKSEKELLF